MLGRLRTAQLGVAPLRLSALACLHQKATPTPIPNLGPSCHVLFGVPTLVLPCLFVPSQCAPCWALGTDDGHSRRQLCGGNQAATERIILFGRELQALSEQLGREYGKNLAHTEMLQVRSKPGPHTEWAPVW